jgi:phosphatidylserine decarboxylase
LSERDRAADSLDRAFGLLQRLLPKQLLSRAMHALARSTRPSLRSAMIGATLRAYPLIDMREAVEPDPYAYPSFNAFFTRALRPETRPVADGDDALVSPVDGTVSQLGAVREGRLLQAKGIHYSVPALLAEESAALRYADGSYACLYLAPYNYHRIHMPLDARLVATRYVPGSLFSVNASTARSIPDLYARNERVVCEFESAFGPLAMVLVGALFVGSIETVYTGEVNPPARRGGGVRDLPEARGRRFGKGEELARFNMGSTVVLLHGHRQLRFADGIAQGSIVRMGQAIARIG